MFRQVSYYFRKTKRFEPGKLRFKPIRLFSGGTQGSGIHITEQEAIFLLCWAMGSIDNELADSEILVHLGIINSWPLFTETGITSKQMIDKCFDLAENNKGRIADLINSAFATITRRHSALAYAAMVDIAHADKRLAVKEIELLEVAEARFNISSAVKSALMTSAGIRFST